MEKVRVLQVILGFETGGAERLVIDLMENLDKSRFEVMAVSLFPFNNRPFETEAQEKGLKIIYLSCKKGNLRSYLKTIYDLTNIIKQFKPHVVHTHLKVLPFLLVPYFILRIPAKIHTIHNVAHHDASGLTRFINKICFKFLGVFPVSISEQVADTVKKTYGKWIKTVVIYNGIPVDKFLVQGKREKNDPRKIVLINVARFVPQKNHALLIEALDRAVEVVKKDAISLELWLVGDGPLRIEIQNLVNEKNLNGIVKFLGIRKDIPELLSQSDIFVLSSDYEGLPLTLLEAMAAGVPVIATAVGGIPEILENGKLGILVPSNSADTLAEAIIKLAKDEEKRKEFSEHAVKKVQNEFDINVTTRRYEKLYLSLHARVSSNWC